MILRTWVCLILLVGRLYAVPAECTPYFSSSERLAEKLITLIDEEQKSLKVAIYAMTHMGIANAIVRARQRGVAVEVLVDPFSVKQKSSIHRLLEHQIPLFVWDKSLAAGEDVSKGKQRALMHDKFCVFGGKLVWTGSFNFTHDANKHHQENVVTIKSRGVAQKYLQHFAEMQTYQSRPYQEYIALHPRKRKEKKLEGKLSSGYTEGNQ